MSDERTVRRVVADVTARLTPSVGADEAAGMARVIMEDVMGYTPTQLVLHGDYRLEDFTVERVDAIVRRVAGGEPLQYVIGTARFMGNDFIVTPAVLIPRAETAGLVDAVTDDARGRSGLDVLDACTGSGSIAVTLALALPYAEVTATDISTAALDVARRNAAKMHAHVDFVQADVLALAPEPEPKYDYIVSNPPYIAMSERESMSARVLDHEPAQALFVPDSDPLEFYRALGRYGLTALREGGKLFFEINPLYADSLRAMLAGEGYSDVTVWRDYRGQYRYARATLS